MATRKTLIVGVTPQERLSLQTVPEPNTGCLLWTGHSNARGYGMMSLGGRQRLANRAVWELANGAIPAGLCVRHRCDTPACVNIDHLELGTKRDNTNDMMARGRHKTNGLERRTHCDHGHELTAGNVRMRKGAHGRVCLACNRERLRRYRELKRKAS